MRPRRWPRRCRPTAAQGVTLTLTEDAAAADLLLTDHAPGGSLLDVTSDTLLAAAAARADITENATALPLGRSLYGYWANEQVLTALLGTDGAAALQSASWEEWSDFVETLSDWLAKPKAATVTLNGKDYTLPETKPDGVTATGVFAARRTGSPATAPPFWPRTESTRPMRWRGR